MRTWRVLIVAVLLGTATMTPVRADTVYAYWSYWQGDGGTWRYATTGPATAAATDGAVDGWRFTLGSDGQASEPTLEADFAAICGATAKPTGSARVAIIVDFGPNSGRTPVSHCAVVASGLSRASALGAVTSLRLKNGFICGIDGFPEAGCGEAVAAPSPSASPTTPPASSVARTATVPTSSPRPSARSTASAMPAARATAARDAAGQSSSVTGAGAPATVGEAQAVPAREQADATGRADSGSPFATVVTLLLAGITLALTVRNARRQRSDR